MASHRLVNRQLISRSIEDVFAFFASPDNLARLTPRSMRFEFLTDDRRAYDPPNGFHDSQLRGTFAHWEHRHSFRPVAGGTLMTDEVEYALPLGPLGELVNRLVIRKELERIFRFRANAVASALQAPSTEPTGRTIAVAGGTGFVGGGIAAERRLTPLDEGLRTYLGSTPAGSSLVFDGPPEPGGRGWPLAGSSAR